MAGERYKHGVPLKEGVEIAELKSYDKEGFMYTETDLYYNANSISRISLQIGKYWHEIDVDGKILHSHEIQLQDVNEKRGYPLRKNAEL